MIFWPVFKLTLGLSSLVEAGHVFNGSHNATTHAARLHPRVREDVDDARN
jgi:hypothetical protein